MNHEFLSWAVPVGQWLLAGLAAIGVLWFRQTARDEANAAITEVEARFNAELARQQVQINLLSQEVKDVNDEKEALARRLVAVEEGLKAFPSVRDFQNLMQAIGQVNASVAGLTEKVGGLAVAQQRTEHAVGVISETLMQRGGA